jgi:type II secretory pathway predicted ATPase ExeA
MAGPLAPLGQTVPGSLYLSAAHQRVVDSLCAWPSVLANVTVLTAEPGLGKTTLLRAALARLTPECKVVSTFWTAFESHEFLAHLLSLMVPASASALGLQTANTEFPSVLAKLKEQGKRLVIAIDEAHKLAPDALNALAELLDLDSDDPPQVKLLLAGAPRLANTLDEPDAFAMQRRIGSRLTLHPLGDEEMRSFVVHRLAMLGVARPEARDVEAITAASGGIPRILEQLSQNRVSKADLRVVPIPTTEPPARQLSTQVTAVEGVHTDAVENIVRWARNRATTWCGTIGELAAASGVTSEDARQVVETAAELERNGVRVGFRSAPGRPRMVILTADPSPELPSQTGIKGGPVDVAEQIPDSESEAAEEHARNDTGRRLFRDLFSGR